MINDLYLGIWIAKKYDIIKYREYREDMSHCEIVEFPCHEPSDCKDSME